MTTTTGSGGLTAVVPLVTKGRDESNGNVTDVNYFLGIQGNLLAADFEEGTGAANPGLNHPLTGITPIQLNQWYHGAVTYDGATLSLYLNGVLETAVAVNRPARADSIAHAAIGTALNSQGVAAGYFAGTVDEVRIWNYSRTSAQIAAGRDREIASANGLLGRWSFNECCALLADSSSQSLSATLFGSSWTWVAGGPLTGAGQRRAQRGGRRRSDDHASRRRVAQRRVHRRRPHRQRRDHAVDPHERSWRGDVRQCHRAGDDRQLLPRGNLRPDAHGHRRRAVGQRLRFHPC